MEDVPLSIVVSQVSRHWRDIALNTAHLWTKLDFSEGPPYGWSKLLLARSKGAPLNIVLSLSEADNKSGIEAVMSLIVPEHSGRVSTFGINAISLNQIDWILTRFITGSSVVPPIVDLSLTEAETSGELVQISVDASYLSKLAALTAGIQRLSLSGVQLPWHSPAFQNLTHFTFEGNPSDVENSRPTEEQFIHVLESSPNLQWLSIRATGIRIDNPEDPEDCLKRPPVLLLALRSLQLQELAWNVLRFVLHIVSPPNIRELVITGCDDREDNDGDILDDDPEVVDELVSVSIIEFLKRVLSYAPNEPVRSLEVFALDSISEFPMLAHRLTTILSHVPNLQRLSLTELDFPDEVLSALHGVWGIGEEQHEGRSVLCPRLTSLKLSQVPSITQEGLYNSTFLTMFP